MFDSARLHRRRPGALTHRKCARNGASLPHWKCARTACLSDWSALVSVGPHDGVDVGRTQGCDRDDRDPLPAGGQARQDQDSRRVVCQHGLAPQPCPQGAHDGAAAQDRHAENAAATEVRAACHCRADGVLDGAGDAGRQAAGTDAGRTGGGVAPFRGTGHR